MTKSLALNAKPLVPEVFFGDAYFHGVYQFFYGAFRPQQGREVKAFFCPVRDFIFSERAVFQHLRIAVYGA